MKAKAETQSFSSDEPDFQAMLSELKDNKGTASLRGFKELLLLTAGEVERVLIQENQSFVLGRFAEAKANHIDLSPYGARQLGVSRVHAQLIMSNEQLAIVDLGSTNGSHVYPLRLKPHEPVLLRRGDELVLGRMRIQILFR